MRISREFWLGIGRRTGAVLGIAFFLGAIFVGLTSRPQMANAASASTINFQARLMNANGTLAPDGNYNIEFKIYNASTSSGSTQGTCTGDANCLWVETRTGANTVRVADGYLTVNLGSVTPFGTNINWDQDLWLTMNVGGTSATPSWDGEMSPRLKLTAVPYAFRAGQLAQFNSSTGFTSTLSLGAPTGGNQTFTIPDQGAAGSYSLLTTAAADAGYIKLQSGSPPGTPQTGNFNISGTGIAGILQAGTAVQTPAVRPITDSTSALQFQNAAGTATVLTVDTTNDRIGIGTVAPAATLDVMGATSDSTGTALNVDNAAGSSLFSVRNDGQVSVGLTAASGTSTTFGSMANTTPDTSGGDSNYFTATKFTTGPSAGTLTSISIYVNAIDPSSANDKFRLAIYADNAGKPSTLITQSNEGTLTANGWNTLPVSASLSANTPYWLAYQTNGTSIPYNDFSYAAGAANQYYAYSSPYGTFPATAGTGGSYGAVAQAIYGTYTQAGTGTVPALTVSSSGNISVGTSSQANPAQLYVKNTVTSQRTAILQAVSGQTADILDLYNGSGSFVSGYDANGNLYLNGSVQSGTTSSVGQLKLKDGTTYNRAVTLDTSALSGSITLHLPNTTTGSTLCASSGNCSGVGGYILNQSASAQTGNIYIQGSSTSAPTAEFDGIANGTKPVVVMRAGTTQTNWMLDIQDSNGNRMAGVDGAGNIVSAGTFQTQNVTSTNSAGIILQSGNVSGASGNSGSITIDSGTAAAGTTGAIAIGTTNATGITIGHTGASTSIVGTLAVTTSGVASATTQLCRNASNQVGDCTGGAGSAFIQGGNSFSATAVLGTNDNNNMVIETNGVTRAIFDTGNTLFLGNGVSASTPNSFVINGTGSSATGVAGGSLTIQGGNATVGNANGGNVTIAGGSGVGTGAAGLVVISTPTFTTAGTQTCSVDCTIVQANVDSNGAVVVNASAVGLSVTLPAPTIPTAGRIIYVTAANGSNDFTLLVNGGGTGNQIAMRQNTTATMIWNGTAWTAAGASSSTTLQAAYDNTLTSAGGAELVVSNGTNANGLTVRDSSTNPVNGTLFEVQSSSAAELFSVNSSVNDYASDGGAETDGGSTTTFPTGSWAAIGGATVSRYTTTGSYIATGAASVSVATSATANDGVSNTLDSALTANLHYNVSFAVRLTSGTFTDMSVYYSVDGTTQSVACTTNQSVTTSLWTKVNCAFAAPASGITSSNAILIQQASAVAHTFYIDNLSVTIAADYNYATDGGVDDAANFTTNWTSVGGAAVSQSTTVGNDTSDSAQVVTTGANQGIRNLLAIDPLPSTLYRVAVYVASTTAGFNNFTVQYTPDGGTSFVNCVDYNTQTVSSSTTSFTEVTCYINTSSTAVTTPYVYFTQTDSTGRTFYVDTFSMTLASNATPNVQIGGGLDGGPVTLLTLDRAASAPIASNNESLLGSMYYDTTLGKLQCYEADGWGACGSSPDDIVTLSPEYTNAVLHGPSWGTTGVGTMNADICSSTLHINDGTNGQPTICGSNETYNFYKWTSPQLTAQTYSIYVTYQLPSTFKTFLSGQTSLMGRTDSSNSTVQYAVYRDNKSTGLTACGSTVQVSTGAQTSWQTVAATGASDPSTCGFAPGDSIVFEIDMTASSNSNAYVGNLNFAFSNK